MARSPTNNEFRNANNIGFDTSCPKMRLKPTSVKGLTNFPIILSFKLVAKIRKKTERANDLGIISEKLKCHITNSHYFLAVSAGIAKFANTNLKKAQWREIT